ncbi:bifunctional diguanylate cyclase/phosphodiesterase [Geothrix sp. 21YS21S-2]|uniref:putative bifunctional diguanylate cyclase/phosphodiesterase n=1 Tax=Geothrix sp. 21YS21S-2 TaxID=3068893 RepID=UPI0027BA0E8E|nr:EAL domain-containing protein [Geothrix sp. 21YS21S-2]
MLAPEPLLGIRPWGIASAGLLAGAALCAAGWAMLLRARRHERENARQARVAEEELEAYVDLLPIGVLTIDTRGVLVLCNLTAPNLLGISREALQAVAWRNPEFAIIDASGDGLEAEELPWNKALADGRRVPGEVVGIERADTGDWAWLSVTAQPRCNADGVLVEVICTLEDVTQQKTTEVELTLQHLRDSLTSLPNRALFMERLSRAIIRSDRRKFFSAVLFLDLDRFKVVNDSLSHEAGDKLLIQVASRLRGCLRPEDTVARLGGDEFVVLFEDITSINDGLTVADRISHGLNAPFNIFGQEVFTTCSMGIAISSSSETLPAELLRDAEVAMYRAKAKGEGSIEIFDPSMNAKALARFQMEGELRRALERGEFILHYQPVVGLGTGRIEGFEALVRWIHPERGLVPPLEFISLAEETGLIVPLGKWVLEEACRQAGAWSRAFPADPPRLMNVNISARQFQHKDLIPTVLEALRAADMAPGTLKLEITESIMMRDPLASLEAMKTFKSLDIHLVIDDFGTGYSSLSYLKRFPVDTLKVDKSFVDGLGKDPESTAIVAAIISLARSLGMRVTAEGIETVEQMMHLQQLSCDQGQGYHFSRPLAQDKAEELLARDPRW